MQSTLQACRQLFMAGDFETALEKVTPLVDSTIPDPDALLLQGLLLNQLRRPAEALPGLERLVTSYPSWNSGLIALADAYEQLGQVEQVIAALRMVIGRLPEHSAKGRLIHLLVSQGETLSQQGHDDLALPLLLEAASINETAPRVLLNLGGTLNRLNRPAEGETVLRRSLLYYPDDPRCLIVLTASLIQLGRYEETEILCRQILEGPCRDMAEAWVNLGVVLYWLDRVQEAEEVLHHALTLKPDQTETLINLANIASVTGRAGESLELYARARANSLNHVLVDFHNAIALLRAGQWAEGWVLYESRFKRSGYLGNPVPTGLLPWQGEPIAGRRLLLCCEQGFGDSLQFYRYARLLADQGATVGLLAQPPLVRLFKISDPRLTILPMGEERALEGWDMGVALLSAPLWLGTRVENIPATIPYLVPDAAQVAEWRGRVEALPGLKVGLVWAGAGRPDNPEAASIDRRRSIRLSMLSPLASVPGISFVSLQKGDPVAQIADGPLPLVDWTDMVQDFADTAALVAHLDLVISVDTAVAHLAAGLGKPVFVLSRYDGCWRWLWGRDDTPWYPAMRLFRQRTPGDWSAPLADLTQALAVMASGC